MLKQATKMEQVFKEKSYYIYKFTSECLPIYALYTILFRENGLSVAEIALLLSFWSFVVLVAELPSAILADRWNRKYMICISIVLKAACFVTWFASDTPIMFAAGFLLWGLSEALGTGTEEGLIYDNLKRENKEFEFTAIYGKGRFYASFGSMAAIISSGILASFISINAISALSALICAVSFIFIYQVREVNYYSQRLEKEDISFFQTFTEAFKLCVANSKILISMLFLVLIVSVITGYLDEYDALIIDDFKMGYIWVSVILSVRFVFIAIGNRIAPRFECKLKSKNAAFALAIAASLFMLMFSMIWNHYAIPLMGIACMIMTVAEVMQINIIQKEINEEGRSTVMSFYSIGLNVVMIVFSMIYALLAGIISLRMVYVVISIYCITGAALVFSISVLYSRRNFDV